MGTTPFYVWVYHANTSLRVGDTRSQNQVNRAHLMK